MKSFHIITFGCQMNEHDSERMTGILQDRAYSVASGPEDADVIILNTCSIREKAEQKFYSELGRLRKFKEDNPKLTIAVAGCIAQQEGSKILSRAPYVDMIFGPSDISRLTDILDRSAGRSAPVIDIKGDPDYHFKLIPASRNDRLKAWVSIMYGCDNFCTYCVVPYLRGRERSRLPGDIITEVKDLVQRGFKEVTLLGQNVNSYGKGVEEKVDFPGLLMMLNDISGLERIRFVTSHPRDLSEGLVNALRDLSKVCESLHLPVQSGSDLILAAMNRRYTRKDYLDRVEMLRKAVPGITLTSDIIVGFPGETDQDFDRTLRLLDQVQYDGIFAFKYSKRPGTTALDLSGHIPEKVKEERLSRVLEFQQKITIKKSHAYIGTIQEILMDGHSRKGGTLTGRTRGNKVVNVEGTLSLLGTLARVKIASASVNALSGDIIENGNR